MKWKITAIIIMFIINWPWALYTVGILALLKWTEWSFIGFINLLDLLTTGGWTNDNGARVNGITESVNDLWQPKEAV